MFSLRGHSIWGSGVSFRDQTTNSEFERSAVKNILISQRVTRYEKKKQQSCRSLSLSLSLLPPYMVYVDREKRGRSLGYRISLSTRQRPMAALEKSSQPEPLAFGVMALSPDCHSYFFRRRCFLSHHISADGKLGTNCHRYHRRQRCVFSML